MIRMICPIRMIQRIRLNYSFIYLLYTYYLHEDGPSVDLRVGVAPPHHHHHPPPHPPFTRRSDFVLFLEIGDW